MILINKIDDNYIFPPLTIFDNDFLDRIDSSEEYFDEIKKYLAEVQSNAALDSYTKFEFLRDLYTEKYVKKESFINDKFFKPIHNQGNTTDKMLDNAIILSKIYKILNRNSASSIDLFLAGKMMTFQYSLSLITGNKKDFPEEIFDTLSIISVIDNSGYHSQIYYHIKFSPIKFNKQYEYLVDRQNYSKQAK